MKVNTQRLEEQANELREISYRMRAIQDSVLHTAQVLSRQQFGEQFRRPIRSAAGKVESRSDDLMKLSRALEQIARLYERTEQDIVDETQSANLHFEFFRPGVIPIFPFPVFPLPVPEPAPRPTPPSDWFWIPREGEPEEPADSVWDTIEALFRAIIPLGPGGRPETVIPPIGDLIPPEDPESRVEDIVDALPDFPTPPSGGTDPDLAAEAIVRQIPTTWGTGGYPDGLIDWTPWDP